MDIFQEGSLQEGSIIDPAYEFCAPQYFDFSKPEDDFGQEAMQAETWFDMKTVPDEISRESSTYEQDCMLHLHQLMSSTHILDEKVHKLDSFVQVVDQYVARSLTYASCVCSTSCCQKVKTEAATGTCKGEEQMF
jgi:hypothetical protein